MTTWTTQGEAMVGRWAYDLMYRWWAPWDAVGVRDDLRRLVDGGTVSPATHPRVVDFGCGTGANVVFLASHGYRVTGVDFSLVALDKAGTRARRAGVQSNCALVRADLTAPDFPDHVSGPFELLVDFGTLDDLDAAGRRMLARHMALLAAPGATLLLWCFYGVRSELPMISFSGPSKVTPGIEPGELDALFEDNFRIEPFSRPHRHVACFVMRRR